MRALQECNISDVVWLAFRMVLVAGLRAAVMRRLAAILAAGLMVAAMRLGIVPVAGLMMRGRPAFLPSGAAVGRRDRHADQPLDVAQKAALLVVAERDRHAVAAGARVTLRAGRTLITAALTAADGTALLTLPGSGSYLLEASADGLVPSFPVRIRTR